MYNTYFSIKELRHSPIERNLYVSSLITSPNDKNPFLTDFKELKREDMDYIFRVVIANFISQSKESIARAIKLGHIDDKGQQLKGTEDDYYYAQNAYYYVETLLFNNYKHLSNANKAFALSFLDLFSQTSISGPAFIHLIIGNQIYKDNLKEGMTLAAKRLAAALSKGGSPWCRFNDVCREYLVLLLHNAEKWGWRKGVSQEQNDIDALIICHPEHSWNGTQSMSKVITKYGLYYVAEKVNDTDVTDWETATTEVYESIATADGLKVKPFHEALKEFVSEDSNYPDVSDIDIDKLIDESEFCSDLY